jgi:hypothetical protein
MNEALFDLRKRGFSYTFRLRDDCIYCNEYELHFEEFDILEIHRFENADPGEYPVLYAIKCGKYNIKGVIVNAPGIYTDDVFSLICIDKIINNEEFRYEYYGKRKISNA